MRKLKLQMQISLDGFNSTGPNDEQKWVSWAWDEIKQDVHDLANSCDTELIGRKLAVDYIPFWTDTLTQPESMMYETAKIKAGQKKIVFTKTLDKSVWENTELAKGNLADEVNKLKSQKKLQKSFVIFVLSYQKRHPLILSISIEFMFRFCPFFRFKNFTRIFSFNYSRIAE